MKTFMGTTVYANLIRQMYGVEEMPAIVQEYIETGSPSLKKKAERLINKKHRRDIRRSVWIDRTDMALYEIFDTCRGSKPLKALGHLAIMPFEMLYETFSYWRFL